ncbi:SprT-like domain-containing protein [Marinicella sp. W31]|uniref:SprT-like domain-containing protein n=1 Tax=Marinicella sp. W31 TaxID=3023713 RepID=UPI00375634EF
MKLSQAQDIGQSPTDIFYGFIQSTYTFFNQSLFSDQLPECLLTIQREKRMMGAFMSHRWKDNKGERIHEITLNPMYFITKKPLEFFQTVVHEMCHLWQHEFGKPGRRGYHNKQWAEKMESIGLMPSSTGEPGGKKTGEHMNDYPVDDGPFYRACIQYIKKGFILPYVDARFTQVHSEAAELIETQYESIVDESADVIEILENTIGQIFEINEDAFLPSANLKRNKTTFQCPGCLDKAWGKESLDLICGKCDSRFEVT